MCRGVFRHCLQAKIDQLLQCSNQLFVKLDVRKNHVSEARRRLPPLTALRAFEAAARHLSFSRAADELHVTPAAVSRQIKTLEDHLGIKLFERTNRALVLTDAARAGLPGISDGFASLQDATDRMRRRSDTHVVTVAMAPSFAAKWFMPRLPDFTARHPDIELRVAAGIAMVDAVGTESSIAKMLHRERIDVAVQFGGGDYPGCRVERLLEVSVVPMCSPLLLEKNPLQTPKDLSRHVLLHDDTAYHGRPSWSDWCRAAGVSDVDTARGLHFNHVALALEAAVEGQGVVLSLRQLAADDLAAGRLVVPFEISLDLEYAYYVIYPQSDAGRREVVAVRDWLLAQAA